MEKTNLERKLICVEYPGRVENVENMLKTMGGSTQLSHIFTSKKSRLPLKFHPDNVYTKPTYADLKETSGVLLKIKVRKRKTVNEDNSGDVQQPEIIDAAIVGSVNRIYKFSSACDYQYLPIAENKQTNKPEFIYENCIPEGLIKLDWLTSGSTDEPYFLPPTLFSRVDTGTIPLFKENSKNAEDENDDLIGNRRLRRNKHGQYISFNLIDDFPMETHPSTAYFIKLKFISQEEIDKVQQLFERRPIISRSVVAYETKINNERLKYILPILAYYFTTGPWRIMWCRFGYDPRKHFESRYYQMLDFRLTMNLKKFVYCSSTRSNPSIPQISETQEPTEKDKNCSPYFETGKLPPCRQFIYQYCDIHVPQVQEMLDKLPTPRSGATCNEKTGWLPNGFDDQCRDLMLQSVKEISKRNRQENIDSMDADTGGEDETFDLDEMDRDEDEDAAAAAVEQDDSDLSEDEELETLTSSN